MLSPMLAPSFTNEVLDDNEQLDDKLDRLNTKVHALMEDLSALDDSSGNFKLALCSKLNGLTNTCKLSRIERSLCQAEALSDISDELTIFNESFLDLEAAHSSLQAERATMQLEDYRAHEMRDEEQMISYDQFVEGSFRLTGTTIFHGLGSQTLAEAHTTCISYDFDEVNHERCRLERDFEDLSTKFDSLKSNGTDWQKVGTIMAEAQKLVFQLNEEVKKVKVAYVRLTARAQQLEIKKEKTKQYQAKLKGKMELVKKKSVKLKNQEADLQRRTESESKKLAEFKEKIFKLISEEKEPFKLRASNADTRMENPRSSSRLMMTQKTQMSREKVNKILAETQRQNRNFQALMPKLATPTLSKAKKSDPLNKTSIVPRHVKHNSMPSELTEREISFRNYKGAADKSEQSLMDLLLEWQ
eukprot:CAMPEP_0204897852 /NCGR_PEP_ID=MMETSP1397-20131031/958_1 /ASSEMBLY_ACC=CAM_ASM_000891 /TAXON_ID=49980 /ORGANISM="Climacostomum Climacostomum virens, Strain Stock W-24" /LENGTH=414 /DNA_ID=CAMNT_0052065629 /DNA_START=1513 /DNA_END=2757 /DNA_ORIENTATION=+